MRHPAYRADQLVSEQELRVHLRPGRVPEAADTALKESSAANGAGRQASIMVADYDLGMRQRVSDYLGQNNMRVAEASSKQDVSSLLAAERFDMVVLDLELAQENGLDLLRKLSTRPDVPVITLAGQQHDEVDRIISLELGADDCLAKPFSLRELLARVRVVLRRAEATAGENAREPARDKASGRLRFGRWTLDRRMRRFSVAGGDPILLTKGEYALLLAFLDAPQRPLSREHLLQATHVHEDIFDRSIDVQVLRLRRKLQGELGTPDVIRTERGVGYVFTLPVERA